MNKTRIPVLTSYVLRPTAEFFCIRSGNVALLQQHDSFFAQLTPRETVKLAAFLQLDQGADEQNRLVDSILDSLGLRNVEARSVGDQLNNSGGGVLGKKSGGSLSGGERRRLSVGK